MISNGWTTLCPATAPSGLFPTGTLGGRKGWSCAIFDTYMRDSVFANNAVIKVSGDCSISDRRWFGNSSGSFGIGFDLNTTSGDAVMRAVASECRNAGWDTRDLDGNGVQPNGDDIEWYFYKGRRQP